jgi:hypothetical protein
MSETTSLKSPFCSDGVATEAAQYLDGSDSCWCFRTQQPIGPDGNKVYPDRCTPGRACYKSAL